MRPEGIASPETRAKVIDAARRLGYRPNAIARAMITRRSRVIGVIMSSSTNVYYPEVLTEVAREAASRDIRTMLFMTDDEDKAGAVADQIIAYQIDGIIALATVPPAVFDTLATAGVPVILYNRDDPLERASAVGCDHDASGFHLATRLLALGHRRFALLDGPVGSSVATERMAGVARALTGWVGTTVTRARGDYSYSSGRQAMKTLLAAPGRLFTALIAANDVMALGALDYVRSSEQVAVPAMLSVAGFDGTGSGRLEAYRLTTMEQPLRRLTKAAMDMLLERLDRPDVPHEQRLFATAFVSGSTTGPAPTDA